MKITLDNIGKKFNHQWIFKDVNLNLDSSSSYVILGGNGSGKSTLLKIIAGFLTPSEGKLEFTNNEKIIDPEFWFKQVSIATPYLDLFEELNLIESINLQRNFKPYINKFSNKEIITLIGLEKSRNKQLKFYSSGMKQRVKLALAILADTPVLLLDEPNANLDAKAIDWYANMVNKYCKNRLVIVASNHTKSEYAFCKNEILVEEYKK